MSSKLPVEYGGYGVDIKLPDTRNTDQVFWTTEATYVCGRHDKGEWRMQDGTRVHLLSINGIGEIRWRVDYSQYQREHEKAAIEYFSLKPCI